MEKTSSVDALLDLRGLRCPLPVLKTAKRLGELSPGDTLVVLADDPLAGLDIPHFCRERSHALLSVEEQDGHRRFTIRRGD
ncbi:sulfurtransferase TusA family protein [Aureimonas psammosilenae]|uniref:sulfurtransferase TusA family protein n=1 Tax=Aureimonas psammosilenae TaxID=2495496 RepID=UPI001F33CE8B|nr:sulfurtransferase TusA family protein [Aureimonas psammosilenae]